MKLNGLLLTLLVTAGSAPVGAQARSPHARTTRRLAQRTSTTGSRATNAASSPASAPAATANAPAPAAQNGRPTAAQVVANIQAFYDQTNDFEADFTQVSRSRLSGNEQRQNGHVRFLKPGRMRWDYATPQGNLVVSDGSTLWAYEAAAHQAVQTNLQQSQLPSALSFLTGTGRLADDFTFRLLDDRAAQYPGGYVLELRPITANPSFERIVFFVEGQHFQVARTVVIDAQGNTNRFDFVNPRVNTRPAQSVFQWSPPAGTQVVRP
jgi:outer membrane lipoprotein carrier protein